MVVFPRDEAGAASSVVAFMVAGVIFVGSVGALLLVGQDSSDSPAGESADSATLRLQSDALADLLVGSPGFHTVSGQYVEGWTAVNADQLGRLGLREDDSDLMDFDKFQNLRRAGFASSSTDTFVNYPDARTSLGLDDTDLDFHVRAFPSLRSVQDLLATGHRDPNLRVTYLADYTKLTGGVTTTPTVGSLSCTAVGTALRLSLPVTNNGVTTTIFIGVFEAELGSADEYEDRTRTYELAPGQATTLSIDVPAIPGRDCSGQVEIELRDVKSKLMDLPTINLSSSTTATAAGADLWLNPGKTYYTQGDDVVIEFDGDLPTCVAPTRPHDAPCPVPSVTLTLTVAREDGTIVHGPADFPVTKNVRSVTVPDTVFTGGRNFTATLGYASAGVTVSDRVIVVPATSPATKVAAYKASGVASVSYEKTIAVTPEAGFLEDLVDRFCPFEVESSALNVIDLADIQQNDVLEAGDDYATRCAFKATTPLGASQPGDVIPDQQDQMNDVLPLRLIDPAGTGYVQKCNGNVVGKPRFDITRVLVVGSNVDHNAMTSAAAKYAVCEWVMAGGTMIVFGSSDQHVAWLEPIFKAAITSSSHPVSTPDPSHPILNRADSLAYDGYRSNGTQVWSFNGQTLANQGQLLNNVVAAGSDSILTVSNPGAFGNGTIILTSWLPYDLFNYPAGAGGSEAEGLSVVNNFLMQGYRDLFLDYGPEIPTHSRQAAAAQRVVEIGHPEFTTPLQGGTCARPELIKRNSAGTPEACFDPITLTLFVYVF